MNLFKKLVKVGSNKKYRKNPRTNNLTQEQFFALNIGAINAEQTMYYCDSLETGADIKEIQKNLANYYDIVDRESAFETLDWLQERGQRVYFDAIKQFVAGKASAIDDSILEDNEKPRTYTYIHNLQDVVEALTENKFIVQASDLSAISILAWDLGRLVLVARCCSECEYLNKEEAWGYIMGTAEKSKECYSNWEEFATGYVVGRSMWSGNNMALLGIMGISKDLLKNEQSPWVKYKF